ncbi:MAG: hypothetical protein J1E64_12475 [Acetatifactor sp.]|nr:hypothetical protein [Acetatifactor sp.]
MTKKTKIVVGCVVLLFIVCGLMWWFMPVNFLREVEPEGIATIIVFNGNNGDEFEITNSDDISYIMNTIKQITLKKDSFTSGVDYYYILTFINEDGEEADSFGIQNPYIMRKGDAFYRCNGELGKVAEYLENLEAIQFPGWDMDPDFPYS